MYEPDDQYDRGVIGLGEPPVISGGATRANSQPFKAAQTRGIADLRVYHAKGSWWHEVKRRKGKMSDHQEKVRQMAISCGEAHYVGGLNTAIEAPNTECNMGMEPLDEAWLR